METRKEKYLYIPVNLNLKEILPAKRHKHIDKYHYWLHKLTEEKIFNRNLKNGWVPIHAETMANAITRNQYTKIKSDLIDLGVMESDGIYSNGGTGERKGLYQPKTYWYRFTSLYQEVTKRQYMITDEKFAARLQRITEERLRSVIEPHLQFLLFNLTEVRINKDGALRELNRKLMAGEINNEQAGNDTLAIFKLANKEYFFVRDTKGYRVHNNFVNLSKWLRKFIYIDTGEELCNLDIRNSQPLLLSILLKREYKDAMPADCLQYIKLCEAGRFYEHMMGLLDEPLTIDRKQFKKRVFGKIFYCKNSDHYSYKEIEVFAHHFPSCFDVIKKYKLIDHTQLSTAMTRCESSIVIEGCIKRIAQLHNKDFFVQTIHDSVVCTRSNANYVRDLLVDEFKKFDLHPTINIEDL